MPITIPDPVNQNDKRLLRTPKFVKLMLSQLTMGGAKHTTLRIIHNLVIPLCFGHCIGAVDFDTHPSAAIAGWVGFFCTLVYGNYYCRRFWEKNAVIISLGGTIDNIRKWVDDTIERVNRCDFCSGRRERETFTVVKGTEFTD